MSVAPSCPVLCHNLCCGASLRVALLYTVYDRDFTLLNRRLLDTRSGPGPSGSRSSRAVTTLTVDCQVRGSVEAVDAFGCGHSSVVEKHESDNGCLHGLVLFPM